MIKLPDLTMLIDSPYPVGVWDGAFDDDTTEHLVGTFPVHLMKPFDAYRGGKKTHLNASHPEFADFLAGNATYGTILHHEALKQAGADISEGMFGEKINFRGAKVELSALPNGGGLLPHPDGAEKVMTAVVYLTPKDWHPSWGGEFEVCRHKTDPKGDFARQHVPWEDVETFAAVPYKAGRVVAFLRRPYSLHGVRNVRCPPGRTRNSITINWIA
jgi:hypothetical protein